MIESIAISNFYCFNETTKVSFIAGRERNKATDGIYGGYSTKNRVNLLKTVFLYGDNGAGKSKLLMAFDVLQHLVTTTREDKTDQLPYCEFALDPYKPKGQPSAIELVYHFDGQRYRYLIRWNEQVILEERLSLIKIVTEAELYHRWYDEDEKVSKVIYGRAMNMDDDTAYVIRTSLLRNNSVISIISGTNIYNKVLHDQLSFFRNGMDLVTLNEIDLGDMLPDGNMEDGRQLKKLILALLKSIGSNIVNFEKIPLPKRLPSVIRSRMKYGTGKRYIESSLAILLIPLLATEKTEGEQKCWLAMAKTQKGWFRTGTGPFLLANVDFVVFSHLLLRFSFFPLFLCRITKKV